MSNAKPMAAIAQISHWTGVSRDAAMLDAGGKLLRIPRARADRCTGPPYPDVERMPARTIDAGGRVTELVAGPEFAQGGDEGALEPRAARAVDDRSAGGGGEIDQEILDA